MTTMNKIAIIGGVRTPFCRSGSLYKNLTNLDMLSSVLNSLVQQYGVQAVDEAIGGAVVSHSKDFNLVREALLSTSLPASTSGISLQQACGTSLQAAFCLGGKIAAGFVESGIACGSDTVSDVPFVFGRKFAQRLMRVNKARSKRDKLREFKGFSLKELTPLPLSVNEPRTGLAMGQHCELMAKEWGITRAEQDEVALASHQKATAAYQSGFHDDLIVPCAGIWQDNNLRMNIRADDLSKLKPAFDRSGQGTLTAGNSTALTDGASALLMSSEGWAKRNSQQIKAYLTHCASAANNFPAGDGLLMAPTQAVAKVLQQSGLSFADFDFIEIHEAFAAQMLCLMKAWESPEYCREHLGLGQALGSIDQTKLNVVGSSLAYGHPFAATGARIAALLAKLLSTRSKRGGKGLIAICTAGGMGVAAILEAA